MSLLFVSVVDYIDDGYPGWVKAIFTDINGKEWTIVDKTVYFEGYESLNVTTQYPKAAGVDCQIIVDRFDHENKRILTIEIGANDGMGTEDGETRFDVYSDQIKE